MTVHSLVLWILPFVLSAGLTGTVVGVHDGDTLLMLSGRSTIKVRLYGIDAPELGQPFSRASREKLSALTFNQTIRLVPHGKDAFGRQLADVILEDGTNVNHEMVRSGMAFYFRRYARSRDLERLELDARRARRGVWSIDNMTPPWEYRRGAQR